MRESDTLMNALNRVLRSVDGVRNTRALGVLLGTFASAGLLVAMAEASSARADTWWGPLQAMLALLMAFYGGNAAGILVMDDARGGPVRDIGAALRASLTTAHRLLLALAVVLGVVGVAAGAVLGLLWLSRAAVTGHVLGPLLFGLAVPAGVLTVGLGALALVAVVVPLAAPGVWSGASVWQIVTRLAVLVRHRLLTVALLMAAVSLLTAGMGAVATFVVMVGGRVIAQLAVGVVDVLGVSGLNLVSDVDAPAQQLMAGLFGYGLRSVGAIGATGVPAIASAHVAAALVGGGVVFALALVLPGLVYLRGTCAVYLAMNDELRAAADPGPDHDAAALR